MFVSSLEEQQHLLVEANHPGRIKELFSFKGQSNIQPEHYLVQVQGATFSLNHPSQEELNVCLAAWSQANGVNIVYAD